MRHLAYFLTAAALATAVATGCSSSSSVPVEDGGPDSPTSGDSGKPDAKKPPKDSGTDSKMGNDGNMGSDTKMGSDAPMKTDSPVGMDGPCNFATFVLGLISNDTNATATPSANLGQSCTDDQKQSEFSTLFP